MLQYLHVRQFSLQRTPYSFQPIFTYLENWLLCSWCEYSSTLAPGLLTTAHPLLVIPPFHTPQIKLQHLNRQYQQHQPSSSGTVCFLPPLSIFTFPICGESYKYWALRNNASVQCCCNSVLWHTGSHCIIIDIMSNIISLLHLTLRKSKLTFI